MTSPHAVTGSPRRLLLRAALRRDATLVGAWSLVLLAVVAASAIATPGLYPDAASRVRAAEAIDASPALVALYGPILDPRNPGELAMAKLTVLYALALAALVVVVVRRHTRGDEEAGRTELLASTRLGRTAQLDAAVLLGAGVALGVGALAAGVDVASGLSLTGSAAFGASWAGLGLVCVGLTAVAAQIATTARGTSALVLVVLGLWFALRAVADVAAIGRPEPGAWSTALGWASPLGWGTRLHAWGEPRWWLLGLWAGLAVALTLLARRLADRRDLGSGIVADRPGPARGRLTAPLGLALRVQRGALLGWSAALLGTGLLAGALAPGVGDLLDTAGGRDVLRRLGGAGALGDALIGAVCALAGIAVAAWGIGVVARADDDEQSGRLELLAATPISRMRTARTVALTALAPPLGLLGLVGVGCLVALTLGGAPAPPTRVLGAALAPWPAAALVVAVALCGWAVRPAVLGGALRGPVVGWLTLAASVVLGELGPLLRLPGWIVGLSPFDHVPAAPSVPAWSAAQGVMALLAAVLTAIAVRRFSRRDLG
ncbi:hypothetical protein K8Z61_05340 [Nocardioides sp. TRM66260-LWL]|uniref:ABC transporter permease n=1 Tax=Nocardioides sp. TRM66260-LWL TaxID=2874478 RepID=UPI001CC6F09B|nr:hypothetical protein [Nocardioides sp. TRM66260-LWL]MBZ5733913.1 hypothetical protein [Nocardioides sp. TRM66260-LWL]